MTSRMEVFTFTVCDEEDGETQTLYLVAPEGSDPDDVINGDAAICDAYTPENARKIADLWNRFGVN